MELKRGELKQDAEIIARHAKDAVIGGAVEGRVYAFEDFGEYHAQAVRNVLNQEPTTRGRVAVKRMARQGYPNHRKIVIKP